MFFRKSNKLLYNTFVSLLTLAASLSQASTVTIPNTFAANTPAVAAQVNANFSNVKTAVDDNDGNISSNDTDIAALLASVTQLQADLTTANAQITMLTNSLATTNTLYGDLADDVDAHDARLENVEVSTTSLTTGLANANATIATHNTRITSIEANTVLGLDGYLMLSTMSGYDTAEFTGINVQINDGSGDTEGAVTGLGNLIVGYNETSIGAAEFCSEPQYSTEISCNNNSGIWGANIRRGSHNFILGVANSYDDYGSIVAGSFNISNNSYANVLGGRDNYAYGFSSSVSGGDSNTASDDYSSVSGGRLNTASGYYSSVSGGYSNTASGYSSSVSGGRSNTASGESSSVSGGLLNIASATTSSVSGGHENEARGGSSSVSGGNVRKTDIGASFDWKAGSLTEGF